MARVIGTISKDDKVLISDVSINLLQNNSPSGLIGFRGAFVKPEDSPHISAGTSFQLKCSDGRSGEILIKKVSLGTRQPTTVEFVTSGQFA
jgi:hypothetical protein